MPSGGRERYVTLMKKGDGDSATYWKIDEAATGSKEQVKIGMSEFDDLMKNVPGGGVKVKGKYSHRNYNPMAAGGEVRALDASKIKITDKGLSVVNKHTARFVEEGGKMDPWVKGMLDKLEQYKKNPSAFTAEEIQTLKEFYAHELREFTRFRQMGIQGKGTYEQWDDIHTASLEDYGVREIIETPEGQRYFLFTDDVQRVNPVEGGLQPKVGEGGIPGLNSLDDAHWSADMSKVSQKELEEFYKAMDTDFTGKLKANTPEHKAQRWANYKAGREGDPKIWGFERWSKNYDQNMVRAAKGKAGVDTYASNLPGSWRTEVSYKNLRVNTPTGAINRTRRLDLVDQAGTKGKEFKEYATGVVNRSPDIRMEVLLDKHLLNTQTLDQIEWVFKGCRPSGPLKADLLAANIKVSLVP